MDSCVQGWHVSSGVLCPVESCVQSSPVSGVVLCLGSPLSGGVLCLRSMVSGESCGQGRPVSRGVYVFICIYVSLTVINLWVHIEYQCL